MSSQLTIGDHIMQQGQAYKIISIKETASNDHTDTIVQYTPVFEVGKYKNMQCSIPMRSFALIDIREPYDAQTAEEILTILAAPPRLAEAPINMKTAKTFEESNVTTETAALIARLAYEKKEPETVFSTSKSMLLEKLISNLAQELAVIFDKDLEETEGMICTCLGLK